MRFSHRLFLLLILLLTGAPILAQEPSDVAKNVRMIDSQLCELYNSIWGNTGCESGICPL